MRMRLVSLLLAGLVLVAGLVWSLGAGRASDQGYTQEVPRAAPTLRAEERPDRLRAPQAPRRTPSPTPSPPPPLPPTRDPAPEPPARQQAAVEYAALRAALEELLADPGTGPEATLGLAILDADGAVVIDAGGSEPLLPASTQKLVTAAAALMEFGPEHRFTTRAVSSAAVRSDGVLEGDLVLVGGGDPVLASPVFATQVEPDRPQTSLAALADQITQAGVRRITGRVLGDAGSFADERLPAGWDPDYLSSFNGVRTHALTVDGGRSLRIRDGRVVADPTENPPLQAAVQLQILLTDRGVTVDRGAGTGTAGEQAGELGRVDSPPLRDLLTHLVQTSDNQLADQVFRALGAARDEGTWAGSAAATRRVLARLGLDWSGAVLADGSGLSRDDRLSAMFLAQLDLEMSRSAHAEEWRRLMAVSGESGTLRRRLVGTVAEGRLRGKTGTLRDVRSLTGTVAGPGEGRYHVAVIGNGLDGPGTAAARALQDEIVLLLAEDLYGCVRVEVPAPPTADAPAGPAPPAVELQCAA